LIQPRPVLSLGFVSSNSSRPDNHMRSTYSYLQTKHLKCITIFYMMKSRVRLEGTWAHVRTGIKWVWYQTFVSIVLKISRFLKHRKAYRIWILITLFIKASGWTVPVANPNQNIYWIYFQHKYSHDNAETIYTMSLTSLALYPILSVQNIHIKLKGLQIG
jgi:hypothetical protein